MVTLERFVVPDSLEDAIALLAQGRQAARALAGGTSLVGFHGKGTAALVDITRLDLDQINPTDDELEIGACARLQRVADSPLLAEPGLAALADAASGAGPRPVRNAVTLGGNVVGYKRWSDTPAALLALDAQVVVAGPRQSAEARPVSALFAAHPQTVLEPGELLTAFRLPRPDEATGSAYVKFGKTHVDYALAGAAARVTLDPAGHCADIALAVTAVERLPRRLDAAAAPLRGALIDDDALAGLQDRVRELLRPAADMRASAEYLADLGAVVAADAISRAAARARGEEEHHG